MERARSSGEVRPTGRTVAIVQARLGSERLPKKVLADINGMPMLGRVMQRLGRADALDAIVVAIPAAQSESELRHYCGNRGWTVFEGSEYDVLDRYVQAARAAKADTIVRITADCPLIDPALVDSVVAAFRSSEPEADYASNNLPPRTFPLGLSVEVVSRDALERAWREDKRPEWREHVTPYIHQNPDTFRVVLVAHDLDLSHHRWTVDTLEDLELVRRVHRRLGTDSFGWQDVLAVVERSPELQLINAHVPQKQI